MGLTKRLIACCLASVMLFSASPVRADHTLYDGCDPQLDTHPTWRNCPRSFDAATPQRIRRQLIASGLNCTNPKSIGGDRFGGKFLQCIVGKQPIQIFSWPTTDGFKRGNQTAGMSLTIAHAKTVTWDGCAVLYFYTPRYVIKMPALDANLKYDGELAVSIRRALGIPAWSKVETERGERLIWYSGAASRRLKLCSPALPTSTTVP